MQPLKRYFDAISRPAMKRHGLAFAELLRNWRVIAPAAHTFSQPEKLSLARGARRAGAGGTLRLRVAPGRALEMQHMQQEIISAINAYFGYALVERLSFIQAPLDEAQEPPAPPRPDPAAQKRLAGTAQDVRNPALRESLIRLAGAVSARKKAKNP